MVTQLKSTFRRPLSAILLIFLLGAVSFGFVSRTVEYLVVSEAVEEISKYYRSIGYLDTGDYNNEDVTKGAELIANSDMVSINNALRECDGVLEDIYNADLGGVNSVFAESNTTEVLFWGELSGKYFYPADPELNILEDTYTLRFHVKERVYGYPEYAPDNTYITIYYNPEEQGEFSETFDDLKLNTVYGVKANYDYRKGMILRQAVSEESWFLEEENKEIIKRLLEEDAVQDINRHKIHLLATKDMSAMPYTQESLRLDYLIDGRWLTAEDDEKSNPVCVIQQDLAEIRNLAVGDTLKITILDERMKWRDYPVGTTLGEITKEKTTKEFKIVGIYNSTIYENIDSTFVSTEVYVPYSSIPKEYDAECINFEEGSIIQGYYSFVLKSPDLEEKFVRQYRDQLKDMGYELHMIENGWAGFSAAADPICQSTAYSAAIFLGTQILTLIMAVYLYFRQHRREFAIARALGIPANRTILWHVIPVTLLGALGIGIGSCIGWHYSFIQVQKTLVTFVDEGKSIDIDLSILTLILLIGCSILVLVLAAVISFVMLSHYPVLEALHGGQKKLTFRKEQSIVTEAITNRTEQMVETTAFNGMEIQEEKVSEAIPHKCDRTGMTGFVKSHLYRSKGSSMLVIAVSVIFIMTLGWILQSIQKTEHSIEELYQNVVVDVEIMQKHPTYLSKPGYIANTVVDAVVDSGFIQESHLILPMKSVRLSDVQKKNSFSGFTFCGVTDTEILNRRESSGLVISNEAELGIGKITYLQGWDDSMFLAAYDEEMDDYPMIVPDTVLERFGVELGDYLLLEAGSKEQQVRIVGSCTGYFTNIGNVFGPVAFMPLSLMKTCYDETLYYSKAEFTLNPDKNHQLADFREFVQQLEKDDTRSLSEVTFRIWDEELRMTAEPMEQNLRLMKILFPIAQLVAMLAGGMVSLLLLLQNAKTAAILRVLGIPAKTVRRMLGAEKLLLGVAGSAAGMLLCVILGKWNMALLVSAALYLLGLLIGTVIGCAAVTRKKPLELLQVKE